MYCVNPCLQNNSPKAVGGWPAAYLVAAADADSGGGRRGKRPKWINLLRGPGVLEIVEEMVAPETKGSPGSR